MSGVRLQKLIAEAGLASRRASERLISEGRVTVNGRVVRELGARAVPGRDDIRVDGAPLPRPEPRVYLLLHKPKGCVTTLKDPQGRPTVRDFLQGVKERVYPVGRLDFDVDGPLVFTNHGELAHRLMHPSREVEKVYVAVVKGRITPGKAARLESGITLKDGPTARAGARIIDATEEKSVVELAIHEGRRRQVKRMFKALENPVLDLKRTSFAGLDVTGLAPGEYRRLEGREVEMLKRLAGLGEENPPAPERAYGG